MSDEAEIDALELDSAAELAVHQHTLSFAQKAATPLKRGWRSGEVFHKDSGLADLASTVGAELRRLREPFARHEVGQLPRKNRDGSTAWLDYVGHAAVTNRLLQIDPFWEWEPLAWTDEGLPVISYDPPVMWIRLTVLGVTRLGVGTCKEGALEIEKQLIGDAIRNAAMRFGVALDLWSKQDLDAEAPQEMTLLDKVAAAAHGLDEARRSLLSHERDANGWPAHLGDYSEDQLEQALDLAQHLAAMSDEDVAGSMQAVGLDGPDA